MTKKDDKWVIISLVVVIAIEAVGWFISAGILMNKIDVNFDHIKENKSSIEQLRNVNDRLIRIEVLIESVLTSNLKITESLTIVEAEQQRQGTKVNESFEHSKSIERHVYGK